MVHSAVIIISAILSTKYLYIDSDTVIAYFNATLTFEKKNLFLQLHFFFHFHFNPSTNVF